MRKMGIMTCSSNWKKLWKILTKICFQNSIKKDLRSMIIRREAASCLVVPELTLSITIVKSKPNCLRKYSFCFVDFQNRFPDLSFNSIFAEISKVETPEQIFIFSENRFSFHKNWSLYIRLFCLSLRYECVVYRREFQYYLRRQNPLGWLFQFR